MRGLLRLWLYLPNKMIVFFIETKWACKSLLVALESHVFVLFTTCHRDDEKKGATIYFLRIGKNKFVRGAAGIWRAVASLVTIECAESLHPNHLMSSSQANVTDMSAHRFRLGALHVYKQDPAHPLSRLRGSRGFAHTFRMILMRSWNSCRVLITFI